MRATLHNHEDNKNKCSFQLISEKKVAKRGIVQFRRFEFNSTFKWVGVDSFGLCWWSSTLFHNHTSFKVLRKKYRTALPMNLWKWIIMNFIELNCKTLKGSSFCCSGLISAGNYQKAFSEREGSKAKPLLLLIYIQYSVNKSYDHRPTPCLWRSSSVCTVLIQVNGWPTGLSFCKQRFLKWSYHRRPFRLAGGYWTWF